MGTHCLRGSKLKMLDAKRFIRSCVCCCCCVAAPHAHKRTNKSSVHCSCSTPVKYTKKRGKQQSGKPVKFSPLVTESQTNTEHRVLQRMLQSNTRVFGCSFDWLPCWPCRTHLMPFDKKEITRLIEYRGMSASSGNKIVQ